jgi:uncharacterized protein (TIGR02118 family)
VVKVVFGWRDHPGKTAQECEQHYRSVHMKLAEAAYDGVDGFVALVYNRVRGHAVNDYNQPRRIERETDMDAFCELYFRDEDSMAEAFQRPEMARLFDDHVNFMAVDSPANIRIYEVDETVVLGRHPG